VRAIPTTYGGVQFRSRLEASVAAHFDKIGLRWDYEPEGFELLDRTRYLPDFYLPQARAWLEVKGEHNERVDKVERFAAELWADSGARDAEDRRSPMVLLMGPPNSDLSLDGILRCGSVRGVLGPGKFGSAAISQCPNCHAVTAVMIWQQWCRNCGHQFKCFGSEVWLDRWADFLYTPFTRLRSEAYR